MRQLCHTIQIISDILVFLNRQCNEEEGIYRKGPQVREPRLLYLALQHIVACSIYHLDLMSYDRFPRYRREVI